jgi:hypothetical protein
LQDSRANRSASPARAARKKMSGGSGPTSSGWFARWSPGGCSWKTCPGLFDAGLTVSSADWPASGSMRNGTCFPRLAAERHICADGSSSSLPTPSAQAYGTSGNGDPGDGRGEYAHKGTPSLDTMARRGRWPTPTAGDSQGSGSRNPPGSKAHPGVSLTDAVRFGNSNTPRVPTPKARDYRPVGC